MIVEWASIYMMYDASIKLFDGHRPWDLSKAHILVSTPDTALQWLRINGFSMKKDDLWILKMTASHSQNLHNVRQRNSAAPMAHDPLINTLGLGNRLDFNQQAGGRCHLLPSVANRVEAPSLKRCLLRECLHRLSLGQTTGHFCIAHGFAMASHHWF